jgi:hypothetical protein
LASISRIAITARRTGASGHPNTRRPVTYASFSARAPIGPGAAARSIAAGPASGDAIATASETTAYSARTTGATRTGDAKRTDRTILACVPRTASRPIRAIAAGNVDRRAKNQIVTRQQTKWPRASHRDHGARIDREVSKRKEHHFLAVLSQAHLPCPKRYGITRKGAGVGIEEERISGYDR